MIKRQTLSWISNKTTHKESIKHGKGLFCDKRILQKEIIALFGGLIYSSKEIINLHPNSHIRNVASQVSNSLYIGPTSEIDKEWAHFINHSCVPNAYIREGFELVAMRDIEIMEEITIDYAHSHNKLLNFECNCRSESCRKFISNMDHRNLKYFRKNSKFFPSWLKKISGASPGDL